MSDPVSFWHQEHVSFSKLLDLLEREIAAFHDSGSPNYTLMLDIVTDLTHVPERHHHPREDIAFERMAAVVDQQNAADLLYRPMADNWDTSIAYRAAIDLVLRGAEQPGGYTEPLLHAARLRVKSVTMQPTPMPS